MPELIVPPGLVCGIDEAGRGPLAGTVVAAAVILDPLRPIPGLNDSKKLSEKKRDALAVLIREQAVAWAVASASVEEIDRLNILHATLLAMQRSGQFDGTAHQRHGRRESLSETGYSVRSRGQG